MTTSEALRALIAEWRKNAQTEGAPDLDRCATELENLLAVPQWQPIETAPLNGLFLVHEDGAIRLMYRSHGIWGSTALAIDSWGVPMADVKVRETGVYEPTHWMRLPERPETR